MIEWTHWHNEPLLIGGLIFLGWLYTILAGPLRAKLSATNGRPPAPYPKGKAVCFYAALVCFYLAVGSPLDQVAERFLLSAHMLQHQIIIYPAAVLFLLGLPDWMVRIVTGRTGLRPILRVLTAPLLCGILYTAIMSGWHMPLLYDLALQNRPIHILEHFSMFAAALFYWWPLLSPATEYPRAPYGTQMLYLPAVIIGMTPVFAYITFSQDVLYPTYEYAPRISYLTAAGDQLLAGSMMKLIGMGVAMIAFAVSFHRWYRASEMRAGKA